ncbi:MAG TPA: AhpC/TSA family protein [Flavobacteriales bacterium]|nr:AhpC/TSA family protein [Flavobacteriales bacterium]
MLLMLGCSYQTDEGEARNNGDGYTVNGILSNSGGETIFLDLLSATSQDPVDSAVLNENGEFSFSGQADNMSFYRVRISKNNFFNIVLDNSERLSITGDAKNLYYSYEAQGSQESNSMFELNDYIRSFAMTVDSLGNALNRFGGQPNFDSAKASINNAYMDLMVGKSDFVKNFIDSHSGSFSLLAAVENLNPQEDVAYFIKVDKDLMESHPNSDYVKSLHARIVQLSRLAVGSEAPQLLLNDPDGQTVSLSSLRGKVVLIDFWASWCKPCRFENPNVVKIYEEFHDKGFEIYGVSLDKQKQAWVAAIQQDGLEWIHVSDLGFWQSAAVKLYDINSIPQTYLIDEEGIIIAKGLRSPALKAKLTEIFGGA